MTSFFNQTVFLHILVALFGKGGTEIFRVDELGVQDQLRGHLNRLIHTLEFLLFVLRQGLRLFKTVTSLGEMKARIRKTVSQTCLPRIGGSSQAGNVLAYCLHVFRATMDAYIEVCYHNKTLKASHSLCAIDSASNFYILQIAFEFPEFFVPPFSYLYSQLQHYNNKLHTVRCAVR
jgi:hypothetical protein